MEFRKTIMNKINWLFLDFDGTLVNNLDLMYKIYINFLKRFGKEGNKDEFNKLNGPNLTEIVNFLKENYKLDKNTSELLKIYEHEVEKTYEDIIPTKKNTDLLQKLKENNIKLALVTSTNRSITEKFLNRNKWKEFFSVVVCGDDVKKSKPDPEIYNLCVNLAKVDKKDVLVIEDSENGIKSATNAGLKCISINEEIKLENIISTIAKNE